MVGAKGYEISSEGRVRAIPRVVMRKNGAPMTLKGGEMARTDNSQGYPRAWVTNDKGKRCLRLVHVMVAEAFIGPKPPGHEVAHWDGQKRNPRLSNLRYATPKENNADKVRHGTLRFGDNHPGRRLSSDQVAEIRNRLHNERERELAAEFGVARTTISAISVGRSW